MSKEEVNNKLIIGLLVAILIVGLYSAVSIVKIGKGDSILSIHKDVISHEGLEKYSSQYPRVSYISSEVLKQGVPFFAEAKVGDYLVEYVGASIIYRPGSDKVVNIEELSTIPNDFFQKLYGHEQLESLQGIQPNVIIINSNNFDGLKEQILGLDDTYLGDYLLNYQSVLVIYNYESDQVKSIIPLTQTQAQPTTDFYTKLLKHTEMQGYENDIPQGGRIDEKSLSELKAAYPDVYKNAVVGDYLVRYTDKLVIYDFENDVIKDTFTIQ